MLYNITPCAKPRMTRRDAWAKRPVVLKYWAFKDECKLKNMKLHEKMSVVFYMPMPKSWSKKKRLQMEFLPHKQRPDVDNLIKGLMDILPEDSHIHNIHVKKVWAETGGISVQQL